MLVQINIREVAKGSNTDCGPSTKFETVKPEEWDREGGDLGGYTSDDHRCRHVLFF